MAWLTLTGRARPPRVSTTETTTKAMTSDRAPGVRYGLGGARRGARRQHVGVPHLRPIARPKIHSTMMDPMTPANRDQSPHVPASTAKSGGDTSPTIEG